MSRIALLLIWTVTAFFVAALHTLSLTFYLYWLIPWIDTLVHSLGGVVVFMPVFVYLREKVSDRRALQGGLLTLLLVDICWELFEFFGGLTAFEPGFVSDTLMDTAASFIGALAVFALIKGVEKHA